MEQPTLLKLSMRPRRIQDTGERSDEPSTKFPHTRALGTINISPLKLFRKNREKMAQVAALSSFTNQRPTRLRRLNPSRNTTSGTSGTVTTPASTKATSSKNHKDKSPPPPLTPTQIMIRRLYDRINRAHKAGLRGNIKQLWEANRDNLGRDMKFHDRMQKAMAASTLLLSHHPHHSPHPDVVDGEDILEATMKASENRASAVDHIRVMIVPESADDPGASGKEAKYYQRIPVTTIDHMSQIPPVLDWTAIPHNLHEDDGKFLTNIPFLGDEFIDKDAKFIDEMVTLYEGKVHEAKDSSIAFWKMDDEVFYTLVQAMVKIEVEGGPNVFKDEPDLPPPPVKEEVSKEPLENTVAVLRSGDDNQSEQDLVTSEHLVSSGEQSPRSPKRQTTFSDVAAKLFQSGENPGEASPNKMPILTPQVSVEVKREAEDCDKKLAKESHSQVGEDQIVSADVIMEEAPSLTVATVEVVEVEVEKMEVILEKESVMLSQEIHPANNEIIEDDDPGTIAEEKNQSTMTEPEDQTRSSGTESGSGNDIGNGRGDDKPSDLIFSLLASTFKGLGSSNEIRDRYENVEKSRSVPNLPILPNGMEQHNPASYSIPNIEGPFAKYLPKDATMHAYQILFCRRCFTYDCKRHTGDDQIDVKYYKKRKKAVKVPTSLPSTSSSATSSSGTSQNQYNFLCKNPDCWQMNDLVARSPDEILPEWSPGDRSLFSCFIDSFPSNYCFIAYLMRNKSCAQVKEYADLEHVPSKMETCTRAVASGRITKSKHRKARLGFYKKFSSHSSNKKNVTRRWINNVKKTEKSKEIEGGIKSAGGKLPPRYMPCLHENGEECDSSCTCRINKTSCEKFCTCALTCPYRFPGCKCLSTCDSKRCICFAAARECDPDLCLGCGASEDALEKISCHNVNIQRKLHKHLLMGRSDISGWGIYIKNDAQKGEFIAEYRGELISHDESERRGHVYDKIQHTFLFELNDHFVVDATRKGNKARFVNSSKNPNCEVKRMLVNGDHRIGIYAKRFIEAGEELFYDYEDVLEKQQKAAEGAGRRLHE